MSSAAQLQEKIDQYQKELAEFHKQAPPLKLDLACGIHKQEGFVGVDSRQFPGVDVVCDLAEVLLDGSLGPTFKPWPWADNSVDEVWSSHFIEHLKPAERINFANEVYRILKVGGKATLIAPNWASCRAYADLTHQWPPVSEMWANYLSKSWRAENAPHNDEYTCDFDYPPVVAHQPNPEFNGRNPEYVMNALKFWKEAAVDILITLHKGPR